MFKRVVLIVAMMVCGVASAQLGMKLESEQSCYLRYERVRVRLTLQNYSGNTLVFGGPDSVEKGRLYFVIRRQNGQLVKSMDPDANPLENKILAPGASYQLTLDVNTFYDMQRPDIYNIEARIEHQRLGYVCASEALTVDVREGNVIRERMIGLPMKNASEPIRNVHVKLMQFTDSVGSIWCLRVDDDEQVYGTFRLGPFIGSTQPQMDVDGGSAIHILLQVSPHLYSYSVFSMIGEVVKLRQQVYYVADNGYPQLSREGGYLKVIQARVAKQGVDYEIKDINKVQTSMGQERLQSNVNHETKDISGFATEKQR